MDSDIHRRLQSALEEIGTDVRHQKRQLIKQCPELWDEIKSAYPVTEKSKLGEIIFLIKNDVRKNPGCQTCNKDVEWHDSKYRMYCSRKCANPYKHLIKDCKEKGITNTSQSQSVKDKKKVKYENRTDEERAEISKKISATKTNKTEDEKNAIKEKTEQTCLERCGETTNLKTQESKDKIKETCLERYGVAFASQSSVVKDKIKETNMEIYGVENISQAQVIKDKKKETCFENWGVEYYTQSKDFKEWLTEKRNEMYPKGREDLAGYYYTVGMLTEQTYKEHKHLLDPNDLRSKDWHLDHTYSVIEGYRNEIDPAIISCVTNLKIISSTENLSKNAKCNKTLEQLYVDYDNNKKGPESL